MKKKESDITKSKARTTACEGLKVTIPDIQTMKDDDENERSTSSMSDTSSSSSEEMGNYRNKEMSAEISPCILGQLPPGISCIN